jgi:hypothetical protein
MHGIEAVISFHIVVSYQTKPALLAPQHVVAQMRARISAAVDRLTAAKIAPATVLAEIATCDHHGDALARTPYRLG